MSSPSHIRRVEGGGWSKQHRFVEAAAKSDTPGPGAPYHLPSVFSGHAQGPVYRQEFDSPKHVHEKGMPHPSKDRTAWMIGTTKNDLAYYSNIAGSMGPAFYSPSTTQTTLATPRNIFSKTDRFTTTTHSSPGPKYAPRQSHLDLTAPYAPHYSFGGRNLSDRSSFIHGAVSADGHAFTCRPATSDPLVNAGPAHYRVQTAITQKQAPRPMWSKADRFATHDKIYISKRHGRLQVGGASPGPKYASTRTDLAYNLQQKGKPANVPAGKWCP